MRVRRSLFRSTLGLSLARGLYGLTLLVATILVARTGSVADVGVFGLAVTLGVYAGVVADFGLAQYLVPALARRRREDWSPVWASVLSLHKWSAPPLAVVFAAGALLAYGGDIGLTLLATVPWWLLTRVSVAVRSFFTVAEELHHDVKASTVECIATIALLQAGLVAVPSPAVAALCLGGGAACGLVLRLRGMRQLGLRRATVEMPARTLAVAALPFNGFTLLSGLYMRIDVVILSVLATPLALGLYQPAVRLVAAVLLVPEALAAVLFGRSARSPSDPALRARQQQLLALGMGAGSLGVIGVSFFADDLLGVLYGPSFRDAAPALTLLACAVPIRLSSYLNGNELTARGHQTARLVCMGTTALFTVAVTVPAVALHGFVGAAAATLASEIVLCACYSLALWRCAGRQHVLVPALRRRLLAAGTQ